MGRDPEYLAFAKLVAASVARSARDKPTVEEERAGHRAALGQVSRPPVAAVADLTIGSLDARLYRPTETATTCLVYFHGGGFYLGDVESADPICRRLANATGTAILSADYRHAPEHPFPAAVEDAYAATAWASSHAADLGFDRIGVAGESAGANLAAVVALHAGLPLVLQLLVYGGYDLTRPRPAIDDPDGLRMWDGTDPAARYLAGADPRDPLASPLLADDLTGLPPAVVAHAEYDRLRAEGGEYAERLRAAGVPVTEVSGRGLDHGYLAWTDFARRPAEALAEIGTAVRTRLGRQLTAS